MKEVKFLCYDGENEGQRYFLLGTSEKYIFNSKGLSSKQCLEFLFRDTEQKKVCFNLHYDLQFWIKDFPDEKIITVLDSIETKWKGFTLLYYKNKMLSVTYKKKKITVYDIVTFFQKSLLGVIEALQIKLSKEEEKILYKGKSNREKHFNKMTKSEIIYYNKTECIVTERICYLINDLLKESKFIDYEGKERNLTIKNFFGASAVSSKLLKYYYVDQLDKFSKYEKIFDCAYYGGRFECLQLGIYENVYKYDINSAYPDIMKSLKPIRAINEKKYKNQKIKDENIYLIYFKLLYPKDFITPFPLRHETGRIIYSGEVRGWYFGCEINSLIKTDIHKENYILTIEKYLEVQFMNENIFDNPQGNLIEQMYEMRKEYKEKKDLRHYIYKIALNSMYGKLAQSVGKAQYSNLYYAGYITAKTRSKIYDVIFPNYKNVLFFATDAVLVKKEINLDCGNELGQWSEDFYKKSEIIMSGFYRLQKEKNKYTYGVRGFKMQKNFFDKILKDLIKKGTSEIKLNQFIGHKLSIIQYNVYGSKRLLFTELKKNIDILRANFKRKYKFINNIQAEKNFIVYPENCISFPRIKKEFEPEIIEY